MVFNGGNMETVNLAWNKEFWDRKFNWNLSGGAEWSELWGSPYSQWNVTIYPRIFSFLPAESVLEIGQGFGRWTHFLLPYTKESYRGIEMSQKSTTACKKQFGSMDKDIEFYLNDGLSLDLVDDRKYDFIFSFDSLIHAGMDVFESYIPKILNSLLSENGVAFIHHSNLHGAMQKGLVTAQQANTYYLDRTSSGELLLDLINRNGGRVLTQEKFSFLGLTLSTCFTVFCKKDASFRDKTIIVENLDFNKEIEYAKSIDARYNLK